jgi:hypothetical protein
MGGPNNTDIIRKAEILSMDRIIKSGVVTKRLDDYTKDYKHRLDFKIVD